MFDQVASELQEWKCKHGHHDVHARRQWGHVFNQLEYWLTGGICVWCGEPHLYVVDDHEKLSPMDKAQELAKNWLQNEQRLWKKRKYQARKNEDKLLFEQIEC